MGSLSDQLLQMGLVSKKQAKQATHTKRKHNKKQGRTGVEADRARRDAQGRERQQDQSDSDRDRERDRQRRQDGKAEVDRLKQIVSSGRLNGADGRRKYYFETRDDRVVYLNVSDDAQQRLESGKAAIVESPKGKTTVINADSAQRVAELDGRWIRCFNG